MNILSIQSPSGYTRMSFSPAQGGLGCSLIVSDKNGERELLYFPKGFKLEEYKKVSCGWPFIFPICGRLSRTDGDNRYLYNGKVYTMTIHGFAHKMPWQVLEHSEHRLVMCLKESERSLLEYPFEFEIILEYEITENHVSCKQTYRNTGDKPMPYYAGFHPYFSIPFPKDQVTLDYAPKRRFLYNQVLNDVIGEQPLFSTPAALTLPELNESLVELSEDKSVSLSFPDNSSLSMKAEGITDPSLFAYCQLYHIPSEAFLCIEPWMSHPNAMNTINAVRWLKPGEQELGLLQLHFKV
ncbi:MAG: aldose epimerase [Gammaproteobacteria bacterium]|nr:aldose epimerase [Gammaproteobacteria bacterium]